MTLRYGMVGGGPDAFIGAVHRRAAALDGAFELVAGAFSASPEKSAQTGRELELDPSRVYDSFAAMAAAEKALPADRRIQAVAIVTPNHLHHEIACLFLDAGVHVICDKPLTTTLADAEDLCRRASETGLIFAVTHNYTGYPMIKEARARVAAGELGSLRKIVVEYSQGWLRTLLESEGQKQAAWRGEPELSGASGVLGDIGSHAHNLVRYVTGKEVARLFADLGTVVEGRKLDDDATVLLEMEDGTRGLLFASQIATGQRNHLRLRLYGTEAALDWSQEDPERLRIFDPQGDERVLYRGSPALSDHAQSHSRIPGGHPEGFIEAFANIYRGVAGAMRQPAVAQDFPTVQDGAHGVHFIDRAVASHHAGTWVDARYDPPGGPSTSSGASSPQPAQT